MRTHFVATLQRTLPILAVAAAMVLPSAAPATSRFLAPNSAAYAHSAPLVLLEGHADGVPDAGALRSSVRGTLAAPLGAGPLAGSTHGIETGTDAGAAGGDENWADGFGLPGVGSSVRALAFDGSGNLYAGGDFTTAGGVSASYVAKWNGSSWSALGSGMNKYGYVRALAFDGSGNLYAGGRFTTAGGVSASYVAKWNGSSWSALGSGMNYPVYVLAFDGSGNLYAGGRFTTAGGVSASYVAKWNGSSWSALGSGMNYPVYVLAFDGSGNLYAGGNFRTAGGLSANRVAMWDGVSWSALGSGMNYPVSALAFDGSGNLYAGGGFTTAGVAKWNGSSWSALGSGMNYSVRALAFDGSGNLYAGGDFTTAGGVSASYVAKWNGSSWSALGSGMNYSVRALAFDGSGNLYAGGRFTTAGGVSASYVAKWNGSSWSALGSGMNPNVYVLASDGSGNLYAGGDFWTAGDVSASCVAKWNGSSWSALGSGMNKYGYVYALAIDGSGNLYAGGGFTTAGGVSASRVAMWDGVSWSALGSGMNYLVYALAFDGSGNLYAGGRFTTAGGVSASYVAKWNGSSWSALGSGMNKYGYVRALAFDGSGNLYAGGDFTTAGGVSASRVAMWNGSSWSALGSGMNYLVYALAFDGSGNLYAGGRFTTAGGVSASYVAKWNGSSWSALGSGMNKDGYVYALAIDGSGNLYAGGGFTTAGGVSANRIAKWNGSSWSALGSGMNGGVRALATDGSGNLYAGGYFTTAGGKPSSRIAMWHAEIDQSFPNFKQHWDPDDDYDKNNDELFWKVQEFDHLNSVIPTPWCGTTMTVCGCSTTSLAMVVRGHGIMEDPAGKPVDPFWMNEYFKRSKEDTPTVNGHAFTAGYAGGGTNWDAVPAYSGNLEKRPGLEWYDEDLVRTAVSKSEPEPVIVGIDNDGDRTRSDHWIVVFGEQDGRLLMRDPAHPELFLEERYGAGHPAKPSRMIRFYKRSPPSEVVTPGLNVLPGDLSAALVESAEQVDDPIAGHDYRMLQVAAVSPARVLITDEMGRRTGLEMDSGSVVEEIPESSYWFSDQVADATGASPPPVPDDGVHWVTIMAPATGRYGVEVLEPAGTDYAVGAYGWVDRSEPTILAIGGHSAVGSVRRLQLVYDPAAEDEVLLRNDPPTPVAGGPYGGREGSAVELVGAAVTDPDQDVLTYSWTVDSPHCAFSDVATLHPELTCADDGGVEVTLTASDGVNYPVTDSAVVTIANADPTIDSMSMPTEPLSMADQPMSASISFSDAGTADTHFVTWDWGDDSSDTAEGAAGPVAHSHAYVEPGVYPVTVTVTDDDGGSASATFEFVVIYDADGGFVTGGGWITSPENAYAADPTVTGKATFGFVSKYKKGASVPTGNTEFSFKAGGLDFHSSDYNWLVVNQGGTNAQYKGTGTVNGHGAYKFMLWAGDGVPDTFRIKIWYEDGETEVPVYDNGVAQPIGGGSIVVHTK